MAISDTIQSMYNNVDAAYTSLAGKGATIPANKNLANLAACADSIPAGVSKLPAVIDDTATTLTAGDLAGATKIKRHAFYQSSALVSIELPSSVRSIDEYAFYYCSNLSSITLNNGLTSIGVHAFSYNSALSQAIVIPDTVTSLGDYAFRNSVITSMTIGTGVTSLPQYLCAYCRSLTSIIIPNNVTSMGRTICLGCSSLVSVSLSNNLTNISREGFYECTSLASITIPNSVTLIDQLSFYGCSSLASITIPSGVTTIWTGAFNECSGLTSITCLATTPPRLGTGAFNNTNNCPIYVPAESVTAYQTATDWTTYASRIQAIPA